MKPSEKACLALAQEMLTSAGFTTTVSRGKHLRMTVQSPQGQKGHLTFAGTPRSDITSQLNFCRQKVRQLMKQLSGPSPR